MPLSNEELAHLAVQLVGKAKSRHHDGDSCPLCGYDGLWGAGDGWESAQQVYEMLLVALDRKQEG